jgi:hypothetical protein
MKAILGNSKQLFYFLLLNLLGLRRISHNEFLSDSILLRTGISVKVVSFCGVFDVFGNMQKGCFHRILDKKRKGVLSNFWTHKKGLRTCAHSPPHPLTACTLRGKEREEEHVLIPN